MNAPGLHAFQREFASHLRNPGKVKRPAGVPERQARIYHDLMFNNVCGFIDRCFPVAKSLMTGLRWRRLCRNFFRDHASHTPYFSRIPEQFVQYITAHAGALRLPAWMPELLHYEWIELAVDTDPAGPEHYADKRLRLNPTLRNLVYAWPVHRISPAFRPRRPEAVYLLVFRDIDDAVRFIEVNALTAQLLEIIAHGPITPGDALAVLARQLGHANPEVLQVHGRALLADLIRQQALTGKPS
jgi:uncharacterized protein